MEAPLVRFIPTDRSSKNGWGGNKPALCFKGEKKAHCVVIRETEIGTVDLPLDVVEKSLVVSDPAGQGSGIPYSPERFIKRILETGKPLTPEARALLQGINGKKAKLPPNQIKVEVKAAPKAGTLKTAGSELIVTIAAEWKLPTPKLRRYLRSQGLSAPYTDEKTVRAALKKLKKGK